MKERTSVSVDSDVKRAVDADHENEFSTLVNRWSREFYLRGRPPHDGAMLREIDEVLAGLDQSLGDARDDVQDARETIQDLSADIESPAVDPFSGEERTIEDAEAWWRDVPWHRTIDVKNEALQRWADDLSMEPAELLDHLETVPRRGTPASLSSSP